MVECGQQWGLDMPKTMKTDKTQKIKNAYFLKDENSTNGTFLNGRRLPADKYVRLNPGDKITIGNSNLILW